MKLTIKTTEDLRAEKDQAAKDKRIAELKAFLRDTDYAALPDYDKENSDIIAERKAARDELRSLLDAT